MASVQKVKDVLIKVRRILCGGINATSLVIIVFTAQRAPVINRRSE
jgi:hypothetical protein